MIEKSEDRPVLGKNLKDKKVVSASGMDLGVVADAYFETDGKIIGLIVKPERETKETKEFIDKDGLMNVPFGDVKAIGRYVVVNFPFSEK